MMNKKLSLLAAALLTAFAPSAMAENRYKVPVIGLRVVDAAPVPPGTSTPPSGQSFSVTAVNASRQAAGPDGAPMPVIDFGSVEVGASSAMAPLTVTNTGVPLTLTGIGLSEGIAHFGQDNNCAGSLAQGATCTINTAFSPSARGAFSATLAVASDGVIRYAGLTGTGLAGYIALPGALSFGTVETSMTGEQTLTLTNTGDAPARNLSVALSGSRLSLTGNTCGTAQAPVTLPVGAHCQVQMTWAPNGHGTLAGTVTATYGGASASTALSGTATQAWLDLVPATSVAFGAVPVGSQATQTITVTNTGEASARMMRAELLGDGLSFTANNCGTPGAHASLAPSASCQMTVRYAPSSAGALPADARLVLMSNALNSAINVALSGSGTTSVAALNSGDLAFGTVAQFSTPAAKTLVFRNTGNSPMTLTGLSGLPAVASYSGSCSNVPANGTCSYSVTLNTAATGTWSGTVATLGANTNASLPFSAAVSAMPTSCAAVLAGTPGAADGSYMIDPDGTGPLAAFNAYCDMTRDGGGWTLVVRAVAGSDAHGNTGAVGTLTSPLQGSPAKLSDAVINALAKDYLVMRGDSIGKAYFKTAGVPFAAVGAAQSRPMSGTYAGTYTMSPVNGGHGGLNTYPTLQLVYGDAQGAGYGCRLGFAGTGGSWCGSGGPGTLWVR